MNSKENLETKFDKLIDTISNLPKKVIDAIKEDSHDIYQLVSVNKSLLDFDLINQDIDMIQQRMTKNGDVVLGSRVIIDDKKESLEILTYFKRYDKTFSVSAKASVKRVTNIPSDILAELKKQGRVELSVSL
ncbi:MULTISPECIES: hypothetical protein [Pseudanabaena]|uniref:Uncharacterized protein n=2 Tax=Pseudanabaena TaxID=1152 RepID=L8N5B7_9CYAN|nr:MULTISPECIES: hypothetical protein [Pseudanabaena]ELS33885.1 hypothetical protein Pse7429DRAFT_1109 [Pseudanabaena biceps PCC 7429]MDG3493911.1 hypothetical protein [Pseudanabaena catenata USMAC16]